MDLYFWGALVRMGQVLLACFPTLIVGWLVAAIFERVLGREGTYRLFGGNTWRQLPQAWLLGMLLPVCSLGVIPVMNQMRRSGISGGTTLAFGLTAPLFNPISVLYGLTLSDPITILCFSLGSLAIVTLMGLLWDYWLAEDSLGIDSIVVAPHGIQRIAAVLLSMCQIAWNGTTWTVGIACLGAGVLAALLPAGVLQRAANHENVWAPITMAAVSSLAYITPMSAIVQVAAMFEHGNSVGAAFAMLVLGTGVNLGTICWSLGTYGLRRTIAWFTSLSIIVLAMGYAFSGPLYPTGVQPADHTHAFDAYCNPFQSDEGHLAGRSLEVLQNSANASTPELVAAVFSALFLIAGAILAKLGLTDRWMQALTRRSPNASSRPSLDIVLPDWMIGIVCLMSLFVSSVAGGFLFYPPSSEIHKEMTLINTEIHSAALQKDWAAMEHWIPIQEDWAHKLVVGSYLRRKPLSSYQQMKLHVYMTKLELLEHAAEDRDGDEAKQFGLDMSRAFRRLFLAIPD